uniref:Uncharacterized protein n=1 Tax=Oryza brachyantha TaxID=4533 RepID=J3LG99_ORYBR
MAENKTIITQYDGKTTMAGEGPPPQQQQPAVKRHRRVTRCPCSCMVLVDAALMPSHPREKPDTIRAPYAAPGHACMQGKKTPSALCQIGQDWDDKRNKRTNVQPPKRFIRADSKNLCTRRLTYQTGMIACCVVVMVDVFRGVQNSSS